MVIGLYVSDSMFELIEVMCDSIIGFFVGLFDKIVLGLDVN